MISLFYNSEEHTLKPDNLEMIFHEVVPHNTCDFVVKRKKELPDNQEEEGVKLHWKNDKYEVEEIYL